MPLPRVPAGTRSRLRRGQVWGEASQEAQDTKVKEEPTPGLVTVQGQPLQEPGNESLLKSGALNRKLTLRVGLKMTLVLLPLWTSSSLKKYVLKLYF